MAPSQFRRPRRRVRRESSIEESCRKHAHELGWTSRKMNGLGFRDWPDRQFFPPRDPGLSRAGRLAGRRIHAGAIWVEFKKPGEESTDSQRIMQDDLRERGEVVYSDVSTLDDFKKIIARHTA